MRIAILVFVASLAFAQEPVTFRGTYIGEPLSDFVDCSSGKAKSLREGYKPHGKLCEGKGTVARIKMHGLMNPKGDGEIIFIEEQKVATIKILVPNEDWDKVKYDLTQKLGEPLSEIPTVYQNGFGARWEFDRGFWVKGDTVASAGVKVAHLGSQAVKNPFTGQIDTEGIEITIMSAERAKLPATRPSSLD